MKNLLVALFAVMLVGCSSSTGPEEEERQFESYEVGSFLVTSPETAKWIGNQSKGKFKTLQSDSDTVVFDSPDNNSITIEITEENQSWDQARYRISYEDSSQEVSLNEIESNLTTIHYDPIPNDRYNANYYFKINHGSTQGNDDWIESEFSMTYDCRAEIDSFNLLHVSFHKADSSAFRHYKFKTDGFIPVLRDLQSCD